MFYFGTNRVQLVADLGGSFPKNPPVASRVAIGWRSMSHDYHFVVVVVVPNRIESVPTKKMDVSEEPAPCQDTHDLALAFSLFGWHHPEGKLFCGPRQGQAEPSSLQREVCLAAAATAHLF